MKRFLLCVGALALLLTFGFSGSNSVSAQDIELPAPRKSGGMPLAQAMAERRSCREFLDRDVEPQALSNILWAAYGFNRPGKRTIATALNKQELDIYVLLKKGVYRYDADGNRLLLIESGDHRKFAGTQEYTHTAPVNLIFVGDGAKGTTREQIHIAAGSGVQNVYLMCVSENLGCIVRTSISKPDLHKRLRLSPTQEALFGQTVGIPK